MTGSIAIQSLLDKLYAARVAGDLEGVMTCIGPDATLQIAGCADHCPVATSASGFAAVKALVANLIDDWEFVERQTLSAIFSDDQAAIHSRVKIRDRQTNRTFDTELFDLWSVRDGKIVSLVEFADTAMIGHALAQRATATPQLSPQTASGARDSTDHRASLQSIVDLAYAARAGGDVDAIMACFLPDATFRLAGASEASPGAMTANGAVEMRPMMKQLCDTWRFIDREQLSFVVDGDNVAVHSAIKVEFIPSRETIDTEFHDLWTIRDGKIASLLQFIDTALVNAVVARASLQSATPR